MYESERKILHRLVQKFMNHERFTNQANKDIHEYSDNYESAPNDNVLNNMQFLEYRHILFDWDAKMYYPSNAQGKASGYTESKRVMEEKYSTIARQIRIKQICLVCTFRKLCTLSPEMEMML